MKQLPIFVAALLGLLPLIGLGVTTMRAYISPAPVYSVAEVGAGLSQDPAAWVNRTLLVRGVAVTSACMAPRAGRCAGRRGSV